MRNLLTSLAILIVASLVLIACGGVAPPPSSGGGGGGGGGGGSGSGGGGAGGAAGTAIAEATLPVLGSGGAGDTATPGSACPLPSADSTVIFRDDFDGSLGDGWKWLGEDASRWNLTDVPGFLRLFLSDGEIKGGEPDNFLVRSVPTGNFEIETFVRFEPAGNFQFAGLLIYQNQGNAMQFGRAFAQCPYDACKDNAIYFDLAETGKDNTPNFAAAQTSASQAHLRLKREGTKYGGYYSGDGVNWSLIGEHASNIEPVYIGLLASQAYGAKISADFDCFIVKALP